MPEFVNSEQISKLPPCDASAIPASSTIASRPATNQTTQGLSASIRQPLPPTTAKSQTWSGPRGTYTYEASAGSVDVRQDDGCLLGSMFYLGYCRDMGSASTSQRPLTFCYNGGPGSSSVFLNFGGIGPVHIVPDGTHHLGMHPRVEDNPDTLLTDSDLVFFDALGTGWSSVAPGVDSKKVWGVDGDGDVFARAIIAWIDEHDRWDSPIYLLGESYGTVRNAVVMRMLSERGVDLAGVTMLSALFDYVQTLPTSDPYHIGMVPTFAAAAQWFHKAGRGVDVDRWFEDAEDFAQGSYASALLQGDRLTPREELRVAKRYAQLSGLSLDFVRAHHLRVELDDFRRELLRDEGKVLGRYDTRFTSTAPTALQRSTEAFEGEDAADAAIESALYAAFRSHVRSKLNYRGPANYLLDNWVQVGLSWDMRNDMPGVGPTPIANVTLDIAQALRFNPTMKLAILGGRYDAATPFWNVEHSIATLHLPGELRSRIEFHRYGCGHMAYIDGPSLHALSADMHAFYTTKDD